MLIIEYPPAAAGAAVAVAPLARNDPVWSSAVAKLEGAMSRQLSVDETARAEIAFHWQLDALRRNLAGRAIHMIALLSQYQGTVSPAVIAVTQGHDLTCRQSTESHKRHSTGCCCCCCYWFAPSQRLHQVQTGVN